MKTGRYATAILISLMVALYAVNVPAAETGGKAPSIQCFMCGMNIHTEGNLHVKFYFKDDAIKYVDDLGEAAKALAAHKDHIARTIVFDHATGKEIPSQKAFALVGSKFKPSFQTMSPDVALFYEKKADAEKAAKKLGGRVMTFNEAIAGIGKPPDKGGSCTPQSEKCGGDEDGKGHGGHGGHEGHH
jgi:hypothetical protein